MKLVNENLRFLRKKAHKTALEVGGHLGYKEEEILSFENGTKPILDADYTKLTLYYGVSIYEINNIDISKNKVENYIYYDYRDAKFKYFQILFALVLLCLMTFLIVGIEKRLTIKFFFFLISALSLTIIIIRLYFINELPTNKQSLEGTESLIYKNESISRKEIVLFIISLLSYASLFGVSVFLIHHARWLFFAMILINLFGVIIMVTTTNFISKKEVTIHKALNSTYQTANELMDDVKMIPGVIVVNAFSYFILGLQYIINSKSIKLSYWMSIISVVTLVTTITIIYSVLEFNRFKRGHIYLYNDVTKENSLIK